MESSSTSHQWSGKANPLTKIPDIPVFAINHGAESASSSLNASRSGIAAGQQNPLTHRCDSSNGFTPTSEDGQDTSETIHSGASSVRYHENSECCGCPMCKLTLYISYVYRDQRRASPHVMLARPSPDYVMAPDGSLPPLPPLYKPDDMEVCPVFAAYGFCPFHRGCFLSHDVAGCASPRVPRLGSADAELQRLRERGAELQRSDVWTCDVCGYNEIDEFAEVPLGTEHSFRQCVRCTFMCYFPYITYLVEDILASVGDDYQLYKTEVDRYRAQLPDLFKIPLTYEAHRVANVVFAWSLVSPAHARDAMNTVVREFPEIEAIVSVGSGAGYIEHIFNRVMHNVSLREEWEVDRRRFPVTSFDNVRCDFYGKRVIPIFAFDALALQGTYSVHVSMGGPVALYSLDCKKSALLLCWPPFGSREREESSMGFEALEYFTRQGGSTFIYIGDTAATGDWRFHMLLKSHYKLVRAYPVRRELRRWCPQEMGFVYGGNDTIGVYRLRNVPLTAMH
jgi:hypothetical protein